MTSVTSTGRGPSQPTVDMGGLSVRRGLLMGCYGVRTTLYNVQRIVKGETLVVQLKVFQWKGGYYFRSIPCERLGCSLKRKLLRGGTQYG